jgi:hypothetical protein
MTPEQLNGIVEQQREINCEQIRLGAAENPTSVPKSGRSEPNAPERKTPADTLRLVPLDEFLVRPNVSWLVRDLLPAYAFAVVFGAPKSGKTFAVCDMAMHLAHGMHWRGHYVPKPLRVAFLAGEGRSGLRLRLKAWIAEHGTELKGSFHLLAETISLPQCAAELAAVLVEHRPSVLIVDTLNAYFGAGDENSTKDMTLFVASVRFLMDRVGCSIIVVHHTGLADSTRARGSGVLRGAADVVIQVAKDGNGSGLVAFQVVEGRDIEAWEEPIALKLRRVQTDWPDDSGEPLCTCIVESGNRPVALPGRGGRPLGDKQQELVAIARELAARNANGKTDVLLARSEIAAVAKARGIGKSTVSMAWESLEHRGVWRCVEPGSVYVRIQ